MTTTITAPEGAETPTLPTTREATSSPGLLTVAQAAKYLQVGLTRTYGMCEAGTIPAVRIGKFWRVPRVALDRWIEDRALEAARRRR